MITTEDIDGVTAALSNFSTSLFKVLLVYILYIPSIVSINRFSIKVLSQNAEDF